MKSSVCPIAWVADLVGDHWSLLIVRDLIAGPKRFGELLESLAGISTRTLTNKLKALEASGVLLRETVSERPPRAEYRLTRMGRDLGGLIEEMRAFGAKHADACTR